MQSIQLHKANFRKDTVKILTDDIYMHIASIFVSHYILIIGSNEEHKFDNRIVT